MKMVADQIADLPAEKRALLERLLKQQGIDVNRLVILPRPAGMDRVPLSFGQERLWFVEQLNPGGSAYNIPAAVWLDPQTDLGMLEASLGEVVRRHESLRTVFRQQAGRPIQLIEPPRPVRIPLIDLGELGEAASRAEISRLAAEEAGRGFDLTLGPLMRASVARVGDGRQLLLLTMHHIISDGWSMSVLVNEMKSVYEAYAAGRISPLKELKIQYADYAIWQRERMSGESLERELDYWEEHLRGAPRMIELPTDRPRGAEMNRQGKVVIIELDEEVSEGVRKVSREEGATLYTALMAGLKALLSRLSGQAEITLGTPVAGRSRVEMERMIGFFVNTLALRTEVRGGESYRELLRRVREVVIEGQAHEEAPFEKVVERLQPERSLSHTPLFQVMFSLQTLQTEKREAAAASPERSDELGTAAKFDLNFALVDTGRGVTGSLAFRTDLFDDESAVRIARRFKTLITSVANNPDRKLSEISLLTDEERRLLLVDWNDTRAEYPLQHCLHNLVDIQAQKSPDAFAIVSDEESLTYRELCGRSNRLARRLRGLGARPGDMIALRAFRSVEMVVGMLGILKAGGCYVPIDPAYPQARISFMLEDTGAPIILTQASLLDSTPQTAARIVCLDRDWPETDVESDGETAETATAESMAYVIYTSGSTGKPKGVMVSHRAICNHLHYRQSVYPLGESDRFLQKASIAFDISVWEIFGALISGACLVPARQDGQQDSRYLVDLIARRSVTTAHFGPSALQAVLDEKDIAKCGSLKRVFCGGEPLPPHVKEKFHALLDSEVYIQYGPTEAAVDVAFWRAERGDKRRILPIGRPMANTQIYILDSRNQPLPVGMPGELHISGECLANGYLNRPELTAEKFTPNPFSEQPGRRLYKTGDLCRYLPGGEIEFIGRKDGQIKLRGYRIELGEIENALAGAPRVKEAVVEARQNKNGEKRLVAYVVSDGVRVESVELKGYLSERLPEYMVPGVYVELEELPVTANGKIDRRRLPEPEADERQYVEPSGEVERAVAEIWAEALGVERVGAEDDFFELGGHSLMAARVISRVRERFRIEVPLRDVYQRPTVANMARLIEATSDGGRDEMGEMAMVLDQLEGLAQEEVDALLKQLAVAA